MKVYRSKKAGRMLSKTYDCLLDQWKVGFKQIDVETRYGLTHVIECGDKKADPLILFHGVGDDSALMWIYNIGALAEHFHVFAIDTMGGPGKSRPNSSYNKGFDQVLWMDDTLDSLNIESGYMAGVSNGGYMVQRYTIERPNRVRKSVCMSSSIFDEISENPMKTMMKVFLPEALFPTDKNVVKLIKKLSGAHSKVFTENDLKTSEAIALAIATHRFQRDGRFIPTACFTNRNSPLIETGDILLTRYNGTLQMVAQGVQ
ncbi:MAG TPA: alpha/beta fold hydrolase [Clostridia bacterium]|nr:alpha/beta fold hydrolase [Clostridia bacterium]